MRKLKIHLILNPLLGIIPLGAVKIIFPFWIWFSWGSTFDVNLTFLGFERKSNVKIFFWFALKGFKYLSEIASNWMKFEISCKLVYHLIFDDPSRTISIQIFDGWSSINHLSFKKRKTFIYLLEYFYLEV